jgi:hypothetical protein
MSEVGDPTTASFGFKVPAKPHHRYKEPAYLYKNVKLGKVRPPANRSRDHRSIAGDSHVQSVF